MQITKDKDCFIVIIIIIITLILTRDKSIRLHMETALKRV